MIEPRADLTAEYVRSLLDYDPDTGLFKWRFTKNSAAPAGSVAGSIVKRPQDRLPRRVISIDGSPSNLWRICEEVMRAQAGETE